MKPKSYCYCIYRWRSLDCT